MEASKSNASVAHKDGTGTQTRDKKIRRKPSSRSLLNAKDLLLNKVLPQLAHQPELKADCQKFADKVFDKFVEEERKSVNHS